MPRNNDLEEAIDELRKWFSLFSFQDFIAGDIIRSLRPDATPQELAQTANIQVDEETPPLIAALSDLILKTQRGGLTSIGLARGLEQISADAISIGAASPNPNSLPFDGFVQLFFDGFDGMSSIKDVLGYLSDPKKGGVNTRPTSPSKDTPTVSVAFVKSSKIAFSNKNSNALSIFFNSIPTIEWSRAIPYLNIKFQFQRPDISSDNRATTPSPVRFLEGANKLGGDSFDLKLQTAASIDEDFSFSGDENPEQIGESGMELFTMPQTLVNMDDPNAGRINPIIDRLRPLASLTKFEIDVQQAAGAMGYKTGKLSFVLHDRSRLSEIADFLKAGLYNETEMLIEYGWEHPDKSKDNPFAKFINSLRVKDKYQISNYDLALKQQGGEVDITLSLSTKGAVDMYTSKISDNDDVLEKQEFVTQLQERIAELRKRVFRQDSKFVEEIRGQQILNSAGDNNSTLELTPELRKELRKTLRQLGNSTSESAQQLKDELLKLYGDEGAGKSLEKAIASQIDKKFALIRGGNKIERTLDPFLEDVTTLNRISGDVSKVKNKTFVSLAKLFLLFVAQPLASTKKFDDIQVIFYNFNSHAGAARGENIGKYPIETSGFQKNFNKYASKRRTANVTLQEFINFTGNRYVEDIANPIYGLRDLYAEERDKETGGRIPKKKFKKDPSALSDEIERRMRSAGIPDGRFKLPHLDVYVECVPASPDREGESVNIFEGLTVLRIHIYDKHTSAYEGQQSFLAAQRRDAISTIGNLPVPKDPAKITKDEENQAKLIVQKALDRELVEPISPGSDVYRFRGGPDEVKKFVAGTMPTMIYGCNNTAVIDAGFKTMQDPKLTSINIINAGDKGDLTPDGGATNGLPIRMFPAQMDMSTFGCPILEFTQNLFCDFQTGTSFDNVYFATKISHTIEPGKFNSSFHMVPGDAYGTYQSVVQSVNAAVEFLGDFTEDGDLIEILDEV